MILTWSRNESYKHFVLRDTDWWAKTDWLHPEIPTVNTAAWWDMQRPWIAKRNDDLGNQEDKLQLSSCYPRQPDASEPPTKTVVATARLRLRVTTHDSSLFLP